MTSQMWKMSFNDEKELIEFVGSMDIDKFSTYCLEKKNNAFRYVLGIHRRINEGKPLGKSEINFLKLMAKELRSFENTLQSVDKRLNG